MLAGMGISGWRINYEDAPGKPDVAFPKQKIAIFVDGCFWHGCSECNRPLPQKNREYWKQKIARNVARDERYNDQLMANGWAVMRFWTHELKKKADLTSVSERIRDVLKQCENAQGSNQNDDVNSR